MIDFHCHLDLHTDFASAIERREKEQIYTLSVTTTPYAWPKNKELTKDKRYVRAALGLHPQLVAERGSEIDLWKSYLSETRYVGEVGLDAGRIYKESFSLQKDIFAEVLQSCAEAQDKILSVHSVRAAKDVLELISKHLPLDRGKVVLHWFTGTKQQVQLAAELGCYFSFNADMLEGNRGRDVALWVPLDRILTESDAPFTRTASVAPAIDLLAEIRDVSTDVISTAMIQNLKLLLRPCNETKEPDVIADSEKRRPLLVSDSR